MGAKIMDIQKMGAAHRFFFETPIFMILFYGCRAHRAPINFFLSAHYTKKMIMGN